MPRRRRPKTTPTTGKPPFRFFRAALGIAAALVVLSVAAVAILVFNRPPLVRLDPITTPAGPAVPPSRLPDGRQTEHSASTIAKLPAAATPGTIKAVATATPGIPVAAAGPGILQSMAAAIQNLAPSAPSKVAAAPQAAVLSSIPPLAPDAATQPESTHKHHAAKEQAAEGPAHKDKETKHELKAELRAAQAAEDEFFEAQDEIPYFSFDFEPEEWTYIHQDPRRFAECLMTDGLGPQMWSAVGVKLKGSAGSFQGPDAHPGLSISMNKFQGAQRWHGFLKWHLNNGAQDNSYLNEQFSCEISRMAGVPASRCAHAIVRWQGRDLGIAVFKEAFDKDFLAKFYKDPEGDLYDGGNVSDIRMEMAKDQGDRLRRDNLKELIAACQEGDLKKRWERLDRIVDIKEFVNFTAVETLVCHWDGYNFNRNNYRLYFDAETGKANFFLHGTDQTFGDANGAIFRDSGAMVGQAVFSNPEWKEAYRQRVFEIYDTVLKPIDWPARVNRVGEMVRAALARHNEQWGKDYAPRVKEAHDRVANRIAAVAKQIEAMPRPVKLDANGAAKLGKENWRQEGAGAVMDEAPVDGKACLHIKATAESTGSWRKTLTLTPGKYKLTARVKTAGVTIGAAVPSGAGAGVRLSGGVRLAPNAVVGDTGWQEISYTFDAPGDVTIVAELRGNKGDAWFDKDSFQLEKAK